MDELLKQDKSRYIYMLLGSIYMVVAVVTAFFQTISNTHSCKLKTKMKKMKVQHQWMLYLSLIILLLFMYIGEEGTTEVGSIRVEGETILVVDAQTNSGKVVHEEFFSCTIYDETCHRPILLHMTTMIYFHRRNV